MPSNEAVPEVKKLRELSENVFSACKDVSP
jgi:hypothetical protein